MNDDSNVGLQRDPAPTILHESSFYTHSERQYFDDDNEDRMENLAAARDPRSRNDNRRKSFEQFDSRRTSVGNRLNQKRRSMDSATAREDSLLDSATDTSSLFSESDPAITATFGNLTRLQNPYMRQQRPRSTSQQQQQVPIAIVTAPSVYDSELGYRQGRSSLVLNGQRRISTASRVTFEDEIDHEPSSPTNSDAVSDDQEEDYYRSTTSSAQPSRRPSNAVYYSGSGSGSGSRLSRESFATAEEVRSASEDFDDDGSSSSFNEEGQGGGSVQGLIINRTRSLQTLR